MKKIVLLLLLLGSAASAQQDDVVRFAAIDIFLDSPSPVAAWQFELNNRAGTMSVVGIENGESDAFDGAPYYDREAAERGALERIVVADFSTYPVEMLPSGRIRIATLHLMISGADPAYDLRLVTAVTETGRSVDASISLEPRPGRD